jgi:MoaA/NifB/PqqE/SkfB family radical SAM enzyme
LGDHLLRLQLWGWGEPFLNPAIFEMIGHAKAKGIKVISSTNGHWLIDPAMVDSVIDSGLDVLICALDGVDQDTYQKYRAQGDFNQVVKGIASLARRKKERGASTPLINLRMLVTRENEDQVERMTQLGREIGVDILTFKTLNSFDNPEKGDSLQPRNHAFRRFTYDPQGQPVRVRNTCKKPWNHPTLYHDGTVVPCDYFTGEEYSLPSCFVDGTKSFARVWRGPEFLDFRRLFPGGPPEAPRCGSCSLNFAPETRCVSDILKYTP